MAQLTSTDSAVSTSKKGASPPITQIRFWPWQNWTELKCTQGLTATEEVLRHKTKNTLIPHSYWGLLGSRSHADLLLIPFYTGDVLAYSPLMGSRPWALKPFHYFKGRCMCRCKQGKCHKYYRNVGIWNFWNLHCSRNQTFCSEFWK